jgi:hypothetical protein
MWNPVENARPGWACDPLTLLGSCNLDREASRILWKTGGNVSAVRKRTLDIYEFARKRRKKTVRNR